VRTAKETQGRARGEISSFSLIVIDCLLEIDTNLELAIQFHQTRPAGSDLALILQLN
jgi:hypothetical protein